MAPATGSQEQRSRVEFALRNFVDKTDGVTEAVVVSSDGFVLAEAGWASDPGTDQLAAIISALTSLTQGAAGLYGRGSVRQIMVEMSEGFLLVMSNEAGTSVGALTDVASDIGTIGYEMTLVTQEMASLLTPEIIDTLKNALRPST